MSHQNIEEQQCSLCGGPGPFAPPSTQASLREAICPNCKSSRRTRDCVRVLLRETCGTDAKPLSAMLHKLASFRILEFQAQGPLHALLKELPFYQCTEFFNSVPSGGLHKSGVLCQDLYCLTLPDSFFDIVITQDIFEHLENPWLGFDEINRVLRPGGKHIFTVPIHDGSPTCSRVQRNSAGVLEYTLPEVFHGDPLCTSGALVYTDFGDDLVSLLQQRHLNASLAHSNVFYSPQQINRIITDDDHKKYAFLRSRKKALHFFLYNSNVFTTTRQKHDVPERYDPFRIRYTETTDMWQMPLCLPDNFSVEHMSIDTVRSETITYFGRCSWMLDITLAHQGVAHAVLLMVEVCWGDVPTFIFPSCFQNKTELIRAVAEKLFFLFSRASMKSKVYERIFVDGEGNDITLTTVQERLLPGQSPYYTLIPHLRRYRHILEQRADLRDVFDIGCGTGYGLALLNPKKGTGLDISVEALQYAHAYYPLPSLTWLPEKIENFQGEHHHTTVINFENIEHLDDHWPLVRLLQTTVSPGGSIFISIPNPVFHGMQYNSFHKRDFSFSMIRALLESSFGNVRWFHQRDGGGDLSQRFLIQEGIDENSEFWVAQCQEAKAVATEPCTLSIIVPVFNKWSYTAKAIEAVLAHTPLSLNAELIVIDNGSSDATEQELKRFGTALRTYRNEENLGFAKACNQGAIIARGDYLVFLNNDTEVKEGWAHALLDELQNNPKTGVVGGRLLYPDGTIQHAGVAIGRDMVPLHMHRGLPAEHPLVMERRVYPIVTAACAAVRREEFLELGLFDEKFINGHEDIDLCLRYKQHGQECVYRPDCVVIHHESISEGRMNSRLENLNRTMNKHRNELVQDDFAYAYRQDQRSHNANPLRLAIKIGTPDRTYSAWGDIYYAECLAKALVKAGHQCAIHYLNEWGSEDAAIDVVIHLKGLSRYYPKPWNINILWMLNHPDLHTLEELNQYNAVCVASASHAEYLRQKLSIPVLFLPQATDPEHFRPLDSVNKDYDLVFVGNNTGVDRSDMRETIKRLLPTQHSLAVWGAGWEDYLSDAELQGKFVPWEKLPSIYNAARIVLNDHQATMATNGFVNNRTFDALACGVLVVSDPVKGMDTLLNVPQCDSRKKLRETVDYYLANPEIARERTEKLRNDILKKHTFTHRAASLLELVQSLQTNSLTQRTQGALARIQNEEYRHNGPLVSILMGTRNRGALLKRAIASIQNQTYTNWELQLICDGGEPVDAIVASFDDPRIYLTHFHENQGKSRSINHAFSLAQGEYVAYLDDDDIWYPDHLERLMLAVREVPGIKMAYSDAMLVTVNGTLPSEESSRELKYNKQVTLAELMEFNSINGISVLHHKSLFQQAGAFDPKLRVLIDFDMWRRLSALTYPYHVSRVTADHFIYNTEKDLSGQITSLYKKDIVAYAVQRMRIMAKRLPLPKNSPLHEVQQYLKRKSTFEYATLKCQSLLDNKQFDQAIRFLKLAEAKYVESIEGQRTLALCYLKLREFSKAYATLSNFVEQPGATFADLLFSFYAALELADRQKVIAVLTLLTVIEAELQEATQEIIKDYLQRAIKLFGPSILEAIGEEAVQILFSRIGETIPRS